MSSKRRRGLLKGSKVTKSHSTVIPDARRILMIAKRQPEVSKIVISIIKAAPRGTPHMKLVPIPAGLRMVVRGVTSIQTFFVYTTDPTGTAVNLTDSFK